ncbi:MAG TPA: ParB N-terminal domain-containing protein [Actinomycetota bacterium]|nr:ParB N-terminal domain-containing protein [Actinomycetota bacterium]
MSGGGEVSSPITSAREVARRLAGSPQLSRRELELLPLYGPGSVFSEVQGRTPGDSTTPGDLAELVSSIAAVGVLQPILVERLPDQTLRLVAGERRLRAVRWGAANIPDNPHFDAVPAVVCPGPLPEEDRRAWQIAENLVRADLAPGELAGALVFERCALLSTRLLAAGVPVPAGMLEVDDPLARFRELERIRLEAGLHHVGAPWEDVLRRLGIQMGADTARQLYRALASLPAELSSEMDEAGITLATRLDFLKVDRGCKGAAAELWAAVKSRGRPELLAGALRHRQLTPAVSAATAVGLAESGRERANLARAEALRPGPPACELVEPATVAAALEVLRDLVAQLRRGRILSAYDRGTVRLCAQEILAQLPEELTAAAEAVA